MDGDGQAAGRIVGRRRSAIAGARIRAGVPWLPNISGSLAWRLRIRRKFNEKSLRPGGTISGPTMMGLTDFAIYVAILASVGPVPLAVTTNLNINFLRKPAQRDLIAAARLIKLGKRLAVGEVEIYSDGEDEMVAHATSTYSIPPPPESRS